MLYLAEELFLPATSSSVTYSVAVVQEKLRPRDDSENESGDDESCEKADPDFQYKGKYIKKRIRLINPQSCSDSDRLDNSIRGQQSVANAAANQLGFPEACVSKSTVHRAREKTRVEALNRSIEEIKKQNYVQLGFDGKEVNGKERYVFNVIYESETNNRSDRLLDAKTFPGSVKSEDIFIHIKEFDGDILSKIYA